MPKFSLQFCFSSAVIDVDDTFFCAKNAVSFALRRNIKSSPISLGRKKATPYSYKLHIFPVNLNVLEKLRDKVNFLFILCDEAQTTTTGPHVS